MRIKFKTPDPRAGTIAQMDSSRGQHFIDTGSAVQVKEDGTDNETPAPVAAVKAPAQKPAKKAK